MRRLKAVVSKVGLDGHYRGAKFVAKTLSDSGVEVIMLGMHQKPEHVVEVVMQEDPDLLALSFLSPDYRHHVPIIMRMLRENGAGDVVVIVGGLVTEGDTPVLMAEGVAAVFGPGTTGQQILDFVQQTFGQRV